MEIALAQNELTGAYNNLVTAINQLCSLLDEPGVILKAEVFHVASNYPAQVDSVAPENACKRVQWVFSQLNFLEGQDSRSKLVVPGYALIDPHCWCRVKEEVEKVNEAKQLFQNKVVAFTSAWDGRLSETEESRSLMQEYGTHDVELLAKNLIAEPEHNDTSHARRALRVDGGSRLSFWQAERFINIADFAPRRLAFSWRPNPSTRVLSRDQAHDRVLAAVKMNPQIQSHPIFESRIYELQRGEWNYYAVRTGLKQMLITCNAFPEDSAAAKVKSLRLSEVGMPLLMPAPKVLSDFACKAPMPLAEALEAKSKRKRRNDRLYDDDPFVPGTNIFRALRPNGSARIQKCKGTMNEHEEHQGDSS